MNVARRGERAVHRDEIAPVVQLVAPFAPHVAEELWEMLGHTTSVFDSGWPTYDPARLVGESVTIAVQVGGKTRGTVEVAKDATQEQVYAAAMAVESIGKFVTGTPMKVVFVPGRLLNLVL
jgi:leucyl-tRNA synthetase